MKRADRHFYEFGRFRIDETERRLLRDGEFLPLPPKIFETLLVLVRNNGHLLTKNELMEKVWADTFVEDNNLTQYVSALRKTLNDPRGKLIETVPRRGYRFNAVVREIWVEPDAVLVERRTRRNLRIEETVEEKRGEEEKRRRGDRRIFRRVAASPRRRVSIIAAVLILLGASLAWMWNQMPKNEARVISSLQGAENAEAFELYRRGRALWQTRNGEKLYEATALLEQAVQKDPNFALAHAALADCYAFDYRNWQKAESSAREAIRLNPNLGEARATIGFVKMFWEWNLKEAESELKQAVQLSPNYATAHQWYAINLHAMGKAGSAAYVEMKKALELEPDSVSINADFCQTLYYLRRYDEAIRQCRKTLELDGKSYYANLYLYNIYNAKRMNAEAVEAFFKADELNSLQSPPEKLEKIRQAYRTGGIRAFWKAQIENLSYSVPLPYRAAQHYARLGDKTRALEYLRKAFETRDFEFILFLDDPVFDELRFDPGFLELKELFLNEKV